jgi:hypothetical protein
MKRMSVRQTRTAPESPSRRRLHIVPSPEPRPEPAHPAERRLRDAGGPHDRACYSCGCGYLFEAPVSASVQCPRCQAEQAW